jgi:hypothetical protein
MFGRLQGASKRVQRVVYVVLPETTSVLIPSTYGITDFSEPEMVEERPATDATAIATTSATTPIMVTTAAPHGLTIGSVVQGTICNVVGTSAPWGMWFATVIGASTFTLNGSASDGTAGAGGAFYFASQQQFTEVAPIDLSAEGLDGPAQTVLGVYLWINEMMQFRGAGIPIQLRITYYASGSAPTNPNYTINIDNCRDFLAKATAANAAASRGWTDIADRLKKEAYGDPATGEVGLLETFMAIQVMSAQRGPQRRQLSFRDKRSKFGTYLLG